MKQTNNLSIYLHQSPLCWRSPDCCWRSAQRTGGDRWTLSRSRSVYPHLHKPTIWSQDSRVPLFFFGPRLEPTIFSVTAGVAQRLNEPLKGPLDDSLSSARALRLLLASPAIRLQVQITRKKEMKLCITGLSDG